METTWIYAAHFKVLSHPLPGSFGVKAMRCLTSYIENATPSVDTAYVGFNERHTMLLVFYVRKDGRVGITKEYAPRGERFEIEPLLTSKARYSQGTNKALVRLLNQLVSSTSEGSDGAG